MAKTHKVSFDIAAAPVEVPSGTTITEAAALAGVSLNQPCGGQGRCGRCVVKIQQGEVRQRSQLRLTDEDMHEGFALACQSIVEGDVQIQVPPQEKIERRLVTDLTARSVTVPEDYSYQDQQSIQRILLTIDPPSMEDQTDDWARLQRSLLQSAGIEKVEISLSMLRRIGSILRDGD
ncbi:MAG: 2Fe-2S iron-sulfur cluster-binding protein, partial [Anaerolineales bacterium]